MATIEIYQATIKHNDTFRHYIFIDNFLVWAHTIHRQTNGLYTVTPLRQTLNTTKSLRDFDTSLYTNSIEFTLPGQVFSVKEFIESVALTPDITFLPLNRITNMFRPITVRIWTL